MIIFSKVEAEDLIYYFVQVNEKAINEIEMIKPVPSTYHKPLR